LLVILLTVPAAQWTKEMSQRGFVPDAAFDE
jgi:hypothetical protein